MISPAESVSPWSVTDQNLLKMRPKLPPKNQDTHDFPGSIRLSVVGYRWAIGKMSLLAGGTRALVALAVS